MKKNCLQDAESRKELKNAADLIYDLATHNCLMIDAEENQVLIEEPALLDIGEEPYKRNKYALTGFDIAKMLDAYLNKKKD